MAFSLPKPLEGFVETGKGLLFVAFTSFLLYLTVGRWTEALSEESRHTDEARRQLQQVVDTVPVGVLLLDSRGAITFMNPAASRLLGVGVSACMGRALDSMCGAETRAEFAGSIGGLLRTGSVDGLELRGRDGGQPSAVIARAAEIDPRVPGAGWIVALADYSATHAELTRSARLLEGYRFLSQLATVIGRATSTRQLLQQVCELAIRTGGFTVAWAIAEGPGGLLVDEGLVGLSGSALDVIASMRNGSSAGADRMIGVLGASDVFVDNAVASNDGSPWVEVAREGGFGSLITFGIIEGGRLKAGLVLFAEAEGFFDVEERRLVTALKNDLGIALDRISLEASRLEAEGSHARSTEAYRQLFDANPQPMFVRDRGDLHILAVNDAAIEKYGFSRGEFNHVTVQDVRPTSEMAQLLQVLSEKKPEGLFDGGYWTHRDASGREFSVHVLTHRIDWEGCDADLVMIEEVAKMT